MSNAIESPLMAEVARGYTHDETGVPYGLVNYMIRNREPTQRYVRVGDGYGILHFVCWIASVGQRLSIYNEVGKLSD